MVIDQNTLLVLAMVGLAALAAGGLSYAFMFRRIESESRTSRRMGQVGDLGGGARVDRNKKSAKGRLADASQRRKSVETSLSELDEMNKKKASRSTKPTLRRQLRQAGLPLSVANFYVLSAGLAALLGVIALLTGQQLPVVGAAVLIGGVGLPKLLVSRARKKRFKAFAEEFPNAVDVLVRGVKAGLPINDCFRIIANEAQEPVRGEFQKIIEGQQVGLTISQSVQRLHEAVPLNETNFFAIVITIQQQAGGNLSEALGNLSTVLRDRKKMKAKVKAMSSEAVSSGGIIACLPVAVTGMLYVFSPEYIGLMFTHPTGHFNLLIIAVWMSVGTFVMKQMINFDF
ncbi:MAG: type II secretion system F family protein [Pseudomonadota bacterium]